MISTPPMHGELLPILREIDLRIELEEAFAMRAARRPRLSIERLSVWRKTHSKRFHSDPIMASMGRGK